MSFETIFLESIISRFRYYKELADKTFAQLEEKDFYFQPDGEPNSLAIIIQHMSGNMLSRWTNFLTEDGEKPWRSRDEEFENSALTQLQLMEAWNSGWKVMMNTLGNLTGSDLLRTIYIRSEALVVIDAVNRQLSHYPYHVGQIVYLGKMIRGTNWESLSIAKGKSENFNEMMKQR